MKGDDKCLSCSTTGKGISLSTNGSGSARKGSVVSPAPSWWRTPEGSGLGLRTRPPAGPPSIATRTRQRMKRFTKKRTAQQQHTHTTLTAHNTQHTPHNTTQLHTHNTAESHAHTKESRARSPGTMPPTVRRAAGASRSGCAARQSRCRRSPAATMRNKTR